MIIADTGFWIALISNTDTYHERAVAVFSEIEERLITTWPVVTEVCYFLMTRLSYLAQVSFLENLANNAFDLFNLTPAHIIRINTLTMKYGSLPMDFADASLVVLAEHIGSGRILTIDRRDFNIYRWQHRHTFENLMFS